MTMRSRSFLSRDQRGVAVIEFAIATPIILLLLSCMLELANYAIVRQKISQLALQITDNASRMGQETAFRNKPISESQINDLFEGARLQSSSLDLVKNGRVILSSLELNSDKGQWIHWQRCYGSLRYSSAYGSEGDGATGKALLGMGSSGSMITASANNPVMFVEIRYKYTPLLFSSLTPQGEFSEMSALIVRDDRDTTQIYNDEHADISSCKQV